MDTKTYRVKGMHCASCSVIIEKTLKDVPGVDFVEANYATEKAKISFDTTKTTPEALSREIEPLGYTLDLDQHSTGDSLTAEEMGMSPDEHAAHLGINQSKKEKLAEVSEMRSKLQVLIPLSMFSIFVMGWDIFAQLGIVEKMSMVTYEVFHHLLPIFATYALLVAGEPYLLGVYRFMRYGKANMDTLIGIGTSTAFLYSLTLSALEEPLRPYLNVESTYYDVTIIVIAFITLGKYLEARAKIKTGDAIEKLLNLQAKTALVIRNGKEEEVSVDHVLHGDVIIIKPGARIPVDGVVAEGSSFVDESMITGEPVPVEKTKGALVSSGTMNTTGSFQFTATKVGKETLLAHIIQMVEDAQGSRAPIQALADTISSVFVPSVLVIACVSLASWLFFGVEVLGFARALSFGLTSFVGVLVIACPCALGLATPTAIIVGVGRGAREGILIKDARTLEKLHEVDTIVVDKTGTITKGKPELVDIKNYSTMSADALVSILASLESKSEHPIAHAVVSYAHKKELATLPVSQFEIVKGRGVMGTINGQPYFAGNVSMIQDRNLPFDLSTIEAETLQGKTPVILASEKEVLCVTMIADAIKPEAIDAVKNLHALGMQIVMLTGDNRNTAQYIARSVGIDQVFAEVLPEEKREKIIELQKKGKVVAMAGDGINDAPALAQADVGIAMGTGTDVAIDAAGITLLHGDISKMVKAVRLSRFTMRGIKQNLFWAFVYNIVGIPLAAGVFYPIFGWLLSPIFAGFAMAMSSVSVVANSLRLKTKKI